jgi:beta-N-acetylhexosaminidase
VNLFDVGQLFITGISGLSVTEEEKLFIRENNIGGVILFKHNYSDPGQLAELVNELQTLRDEYPLFISVDQEGGRVIRFQSHFTQFPSMFELGELDSPKLTFEVHKALGEELVACGVNVNYSPTCDIWTNESNKVIGDRAFGKNADVVERNVSAAIRGLHTSNVLACAKHFPGHGNTTKDSHFDLPFVKKSIEEIRKEELIPFIKASKSRVEFIMMAHLVVDAIDKELPCTLSEKAYEFLRSELKYKKIIITDDMEMKAIPDNYGVAQAGKMALEAGADILLYRSFEKTKEVFESITESIQQQEIKKAVLEQKIKRVVDCKKRFFSEYTPTYIPSLSKIFKPDRNTQLLKAIKK